MCVSNLEIHLLKMATKPISDWIDEEINPLNRGTMALSDDQKKYIIYW